MAKKQNRENFGLSCSVCQNQNYVTSKNTINSKDKLALKKYCRKCRVSTNHQEFKLKS